MRKHWTERLECKAKELFSRQASAKTPEHRRDNQIAKNKPYLVLKPRTGLRRQVDSEVREAMAIERSKQIERRKAEISSKLEKDREQARSR